MIVFKLERMNWYNPNAFQYVGSPENYEILFKDEYPDFYDFLIEHDVNYSLKISEMPIGKLGILLVIFAELIIEDTEEKEVLCKLVF